MICVHECGACFYVRVQIKVSRHIEEYAPDKVRDHQSNENQSEYVIDIQDEVVFHDCNMVTIFFLEWFEYLVKPFYI